MSMGGTRSVFHEHHFVLERNLFFAANVFFPFFGLRYFRTGRLSLSWTLKGYECPLNIVSEEWFLNQLDFVIRPSTTRLDATKEDCSILLLSIIHDRMLKFSVTKTGDLQVIQVLTQLESTHSFHQCLNRFRKFGGSMSTKITRTKIQFIFNRFLLVVESTDSLGIQASFET